MRLKSAPAFRGRFTLPGDKSISHRMALFAAMADGETRIANYSSAADCESTLRCLEALGLRVRREGRSVSVLGTGPDGLRAAPGPLDAGNSGSTLRMLAGVLAGRPFRSTVTGDVSLCRRPAERVATPLRAMGARVETTNGRPPVTITGGALTGVTWDLKVPSAQVKTAILLAGLQAEGTTTVREPLPSRDHTERLLPLFGVPVEVSGDALSVRRQDALRPVDLTVPGDASSAAFLIVAALILPDSEVRIEGVLLNPRRTAFVDVLVAMGGDVRIGVEESSPEPVGWIEARSSKLEGVAVAPEIVPGLIDEVPALAVAAAHARGSFTITGASELRVKESDRIAALADGLGRMGVAVDEHDDGLTIHGGRRLQGAEVTAHGDHRIAMALSVAALAAAGDTDVEDAACASVSFPEFFDLLERGCQSARA